MARNEPNPSDWEGQPPVSPGGNGEIEWSVVGYIPIEATRSGLGYEGYVNLDPESEQRQGQRFPVQPFPDSWDFLPDIDLVYIKITDRAGNDQYVVVAGPFDDWDDLAAAIDDMWEFDY